MVQQKGRKPCVKSSVRTVSLCPSCHLLVKMLLCLSWLPAAANYEIITYRKISFWTTFYITIYTTNFGLSDWRVKQTRKVCHTKYLPFDFMVWIEQVLQHYAAVLWNDKAIIKVLGFTHGIFTWKQFWKLWKPLSLALTDIYYFN